MRIIKKLFVVMALTCAAAWLLKTAAIAAYGGAEADGEPLVALLWGVGMLSYLLACATGVVLLLGRAPVWVRSVAGVLTVPVSFAALDLLDTAAKAAYQADGWFRDEVALVLVALAMAVVGGRTVHWLRAGQAAHR